MNVDTLSVAADVETSQLMAIEAGELDPDYETLLRIGDALDVGLGTLFTDAESITVDRAESRTDETPQRPISVRVRGHRSSTPDSHDLEAELTITLAGLLSRLLPSRFFRSGRDE